MHISVVLCTYNRCESLAETLESTARLRLPGSVEWEILVVDNNSTDQTPAVVERYSRRYPDRFRDPFEPCQGKSHALNTGIRKSEGDLLAFVDDDVIVEPTWLQNLTGALHDGRWAGAGGRILPESGVSLPPWVPRHERYGLAPLALFDLGPDADVLSEPPFGTNMAFRREMFQKHGVFRTDLGPRPGSAIRSEDTDFGGRLLAAGERLRYEPSAVVYHALPKERLRKQYFLEWWAGKARADVLQSGIPEGATWSCLGVPLHLLRRLGVWTLRWLVATNPARRFSCKINVWTTLGTITECRRSYRGASRRPAPTALG